MAIKETVIIFLGSSLICLAETQPAFHTPVNPTPPKRSNGEDPQTQKEKSNLYIVLFKRDTPEIPDWIAASQRSRITLEKRSTTIGDKGRGVEPSSIYFLSFPHFGENRTTLGVIVAKNPDNKDEWLVYPVILKNDPKDRSKLITELEKPFAKTSTYVEGAESTEFYSLSPPSVQLFTLRLFNPSGD